MKELKESKYVGREERKRRSAAEETDLGLRFKIYSPTDGTLSSGHR